MANIEHSVLTGSDLHEPKGVSSAADNSVARAVSGAISWGKIDDPDYIDDDTLDIDTIDETSIKGLNTLYLTTNIEDLSSAASYWVVVPVAGNITAAWSVIDGAIDNDDTTITLERSGVAMTDGVITITQAGSAAGDVDTCAPSANNDMTAALPLELVVAPGTSTNTTKCTVTIKLAVT